MLIQNQTFNAPSAKQGHLQELIDIVLDKQQKGVKVRVIFRSFGGKTRENLEALKDIRFDMSAIRTHPHCHTKGIIVDKRRILLGSHNLSESGVSVNRDASLLFDDAPLAAYFRELFEYDWQWMSDSKIGEEIAGLRLIGPDESTPPGFERVPPDEYLEWL